MKQAIVFVDANNWYHNVKKFVDPGGIDVLKVAGHLCKEKGYGLVQVQWYASTPSIADGEAVYYRHMAFLKHLEKSGIKVVTRKLQRLSNKEILSKMRAVIDRIGLCKACKPRVESAFLGLADIKKKEKGIDVWVAIDMIKDSLIEKRCDACILISGDADFTPALELIQANGREVLTAMVPWGYSAELRQKFGYVVLNADLLKKCMRESKGSASVAVG